jgi:hypothetical protein
MMKRDQLFIKDKFLIDRSCQRIDHQSLSSIHNTDQSIYKFYFLIGTGGSINGVEPGRQRLEIVRRRTKVAAGAARFPVTIDPPPLLRHLPDCDRPIGRRERLAGEGCWSPGNDTGGCDEGFKGFLSPLR